MSQRPTPEDRAEVVAGMQDLVLDIARALVDEPELVTVETVADGDATVIRLRVSQKDVGKIIGKQGRTARSLRTILGAASMKLHHRFSLDILEHGEAPRSSGQLSSAPEEE
jgi:uncharacterized protein